jgi:replicative DNA helicase
MLRGNNALVDAEAAGLTAEHFGHPKTRAVFQAATMVRERGEAIDIITLDAQLRRTGELELVGGIEGLAQLDRFATAHALDAHVAVARDAAVGRMLVESCERTVESLLDPDMRGFSIDEVCGRLQADVAHLASSGGVRAQLIGAAEIAEQAMAEWDQRNEGTAPCASIGFAELDDLLVPTPGALIGVLGRSGHGKTALVCSIATALQFDLQADATGSIPPFLEYPTPVLFCSAEMRATQVQNRMASAISRIEGRLITRPNHEPPRVRDRLAAAHRALGQTTIKYMADDDAIHFDRIVSAIHAFAYANRDAAGVPVVVIDYLQLLTISGRFDRNVDRFDHALRILTTMAKSLGIVIILCVQPVKNSATTRLTVADVREAGTLENHAKIIIGLFRPWQVHEPAQRKEGERQWAALRAAEEAALRGGRPLAPHERERLEQLTKEIGTVFIDGLKARDGNTGDSCELVFEGRYTSFRSIRGAA